MGEEIKEKSRFYINLELNQIFYPEQDDINEAYCQNVDLKTWLKLTKNESYWKIYAAENANFEPFDVNKPKLDILIPIIRDRKLLINAYYEITGSKKEVLLKGKEK